jgi:CheY-like chemotaxis protein
MTEQQNLKTILIVDDDSDYCELTQTRLENAGYQVACARTGKQAIDMVENWRRPHIIILDVDMPEQNGIATLVDLNAKAVTEKRRIPIIMATGLQSKQLQELIKTLHPDGFLQKPYSADDLITQVNKVLK